MNTKNEYHLRSVTNVARNCRIRRVERSTSSAMGGGYDRVCLVTLGLSGVTSVTPCDRCHAVTLSRCHSHHVDTRCTEATSNKFESEHMYRVLASLPSLRWRHSRPGGVCKTPVPVPGPGHNGQDDPTVWLRHELVCEGTELANYYKTTAGGLAVGLILT